jgi:hypothetical protein
VGSAIAYFEILRPGSLREIPGWRVAPALAPLGDSKVLGIEVFAASAGKCQRRQDEELEEVFERHLQLRSAQ